MTKPISVVTYSLYQKVSGDGPAWLCQCRENGQSGLLFGGATAEEAESRARDYASRVLNTPERLAVMAARMAAAREARARTEARKRKKGEMT